MSLVCRFHTRLGMFSPGTPVSSYTPKIGIIPINSVPLFWYYVVVITLPFKISIHTNIFFINLPLDIDIPPLTANAYGHGYRKQIDLSKQLPSYAKECYLFTCAICDSLCQVFKAVIFFYRCQVHNCFNFLTVTVTACAICIGLLPFYRCHL